MSEKPKLTRTPVPQGKPVQEGTGGTTYGGYDYATLEAAFEVWKPRPNWKMPIDKIITQAALKNAGMDIGAVETSITFYAGCIAYVSQKRPGGSYRVQADGYYMSVGS